MDTKDEIENEDHDEDGNTTHANKEHPIQGFNHKASAINVFKSLIVIKTCLQPHAKDMWETNKKIADTIFIAGNQFTSITYFFKEYEEPKSTYVFCMENTKISIIKSLN